MPNGTSYDRLGGPWTADDEAVIAAAEVALAKGLELNSWWKTTDGSPALQRFELVSSYNHPSEASGFFDVAPLGDRPFPVMGDVEECLYDRPKTDGSVAAAAEWMRRQIREFALHYLLRVLDTRDPEVLPESATRVPEWMRPVSWCPDDASARRGFGYSQLYYKLTDGRVGKFKPEDRFAIIDLRQLGETYEWIVMLVRIFDFDLDFRPFGPQLPGLQLPLRTRQLVVLNRDFVIDRDRPEPGVLGDYGFGYAVLRNPASRSLLAYGPGQFEAGYQLFHFRVLEDGEVRSRLRFMVNRPRRLLNVSLDPCEWGLEIADLLTAGRGDQLLAPMRKVLDRLPFRGADFSPIFSSIDLLNWSTGGLAERQLCISGEQLEKDMLVKHYLQTHETLEGSLFTWRQIPDWLDRAALPRWILTGQNC